MGAQAKGALMQKAERLALSTVRSVLEPDGLSVALMASARHPHILVRAPDGWTRSFTIACSARADDQCQSNYARQKANALLREFRASRPAAPAASNQRAADQRQTAPRRPGEALPPARPPRRGDRKPRR
jgi:hypothetical protein